MNWILILKIEIVSSVVTSFGSPLCGSSSSLTTTTHANPNDIIYIIYLYLPEPSCLEILTPDILCLEFMHQMQTVSN